MTPLKRLDMETTRCLQQRHQRHRQGEGSFTVQVSRAIVCIQAAFFSGVLNLAMESVAATKEFICTSQDR